MVRKFKEWLAKIIDELIVQEKIHGINKLDNTATDALLNFNECNDKCDTTRTELELLREQVKAMREELDILRDGGLSNVTPAKVIDEWLNGKEESNG